MKRTNLFYFLASILLYVECINALEVTLGKDEEICMTKQNTADKCGVKPDILEIKGLLSELKNDITRMNAEIVQIKETINKTGAYPNKDTVYASCSQALLRDRFAPNGVYRIKTKTPKQYSEVYCHMTSLPACSGGGWTMVMKINGKKETFSYHSSFWSDLKYYSLDGGKTGLDDKETKLPTYWSTPFKQLCIGMKISNSVHFIPISYTSNSLSDILASGKYLSTSIPRKTWKSLYQDSSLQKNCGRQGFNVVGGDARHHRVRIGIIGNGSENDCRTPDSFIGFGGIEASTRSTCGGSIINSCGNSACGEVDNGNKEVKAMGYIFVR